MELENAHGTTIPINDDSATDIGRNLGLGFPPSSPDRTVSRRHLSLRPTAGPRVSFHVLGRNPIVIHETDTGAERIYKNSESGELSVGDKLSLSLKTPSFLVLKWRNGEEEREDEEDMEKRRILDAVERRKKMTLERRSAKREEEEFDLGWGDLDLSEVDPAKAFGFLVKGHEFDQYPKGMIVDFKHWNWFLEVPRKNTEQDDGSDDEVTRSRGKRVKKTYHGADEDEDEEWTGESDEEKAVVVKGGSSKRPKYSTRSKDPKKMRKDVKARTRKDEVDSDKEDEDEEDETLGGFIVDVDEEEHEANEEESEEELEEEDEDEEDDESDDFNI